ncbi:MAG: hypothetical protein HY518_00575 [Candidatus Aenigmarchaeota archaeon]|nr:hypothetical protein [Candidatus Aenigmarchaeota archaeon]
MEIHLSDLMKSFSGNADVLLEMDGSEFLRASLKGKDITIEVKDPLKAMEMGLHKMMEGKKSGKAGIRGMLKSMGFRIKLKYSIFEVEI